MGRPRKNPVADATNESMEASVSIEKTAEGDIIAKPQATKDKSLEDVINDIKKMKAVTGYDVRITIQFTHPVLGTLSSNEEAFKKYQLAKATEGRAALIADEEERKRFLEVRMAQEQQEYAAARENLVKNALEAGEDPDELEIRLDKSPVTMFPRNENNVPVLQEHQVYGLLKEVAKAVKDIDDTVTSGIKNYKQDIETHVIMLENSVPIEFEGESTIFSRPVRKGFPPSVTITSSEMIPAGAKCTFTLRIANKRMFTPIIKEIIGYGQYHGLLQWRNAGYGRFEVLNADCCDCDLNLNIADKIHVVDHLD